MSAGTLVPFMSEIALPGDSWEIELNAIVRTLPTIGPLFGSYKVQLDVFQVPFRLYQKQLKMNSLNIGLEMQNVHLPLIKVSADSSFTNANSQIEPSALLSHLGIRGIGKGNGEQWRTFFGVDYLAYFDIFKNYYANKQEDYAWVIHNNLLSNNATLIDAKNRYNLANGTSTDISITIVTGKQIGRAHV